MVAIIFCICDDVRNESVAQPIEDVETCRGDEGASGGVKVRECSTQSFDMMIPIMEEKASTDSCKNSISNAEAPIQPSVEQFTCRNTDT